MCAAAVNLRSGPKMERRHAAPPPRGGRSGGTDPRAEMTDPLGGKERIEYGGYVSLHALRAPAAPGADEPERRDRDDDTEKALKNRALGRRAIMRLRACWGALPPATAVVPRRHVSMWDPLESTCRHASLSIL